MIENINPLRPDLNQPDVSVPQDMSVVREHPALPKSRIFTVLPSIKREQMIKFIIQSECNRTTNFGSAVGFQKPPIFFHRPPRRGIEMLKKNAEIQDYQAEELTCFRVIPLE